MGVVVGDSGDLTREVALKVQAHDLPLVANGGAQVVDSATPGQELPMSLFPGLHSLTHGRAGRTQDEGEVRHGKESPLLICLLAEAGHSLGKQGLSLGAISQLLDFVTGPQVEDDAPVEGIGHCLSISGTVGGIHRQPYGLLGLNLLPVGGILFKELQHPLGKHIGNGQLVIIAEVEHQLPAQDIEERFLLEDTEACPEQSEGMDF